VPPAKKRLDGWSGKIAGHIREADKFDCAILQAGRRIDWGHGGDIARPCLPPYEFGCLELASRNRDAKVIFAPGEYRLRGSFQTTWEVTRAQPGTGGILNFFSGGSAAVAAGLTGMESQANASLAELARCAPASERAWNGRVIRNAWDRNPWSLGSYALVKPGQYTSFYGVEAQPRGHVYFAGEHTSVESQGYLNGAVESGMRAAGEVLASLGATRQKSA